MWGDREVGWLFPPVLLVLGVGECEICRDDHVDRGGGRKGGREGGRGKTE